MFWLLLALTGAKIDQTDVPLTEDEKMEYLLESLGHNNEPDPSAEEFRRVEVNMTGVTGVALVDAPRRRALGVSMAKAIASAFVRYMRNNRRRSAFLKKVGEVFGSEGQAYAAANFLGENSHYATTQPHMMLRDNLLPGPWDLVDPHNWKMMMWRFQNKDRAAARATRREQLARQRKNRVAHLKLWYRLPYWKRQELLCQRNRWCSHCCSLRGSRRYGRIFSRYGAKIQCPRSKPYSSDPSRNCKRCPPNGFCPDRPPCERKKYGWCKHHPYVPNTETRTFNGRRCGYNCICARARARGYNICG